MKSVTGDPAEIERVVNKVDGLMVHLEMVHFDPFLPTHRHEWKTAMGRFKREVEIIEQEANRFVYTVYSNRVHVYRTSIPCVSLC